MEITPILIKTQLILEIMWAITMVTIMETTMAIIIDTGKTAKITIKVNKDRKRKTRKVMFI